MAIFAFAQTVDKTHYSGEPMTRYILSFGIFDSLRSGIGEYSTAEIKDIKREILELREEGFKVIEDRLPLIMMGRKEVDLDTGEVSSPTHCIITRTPLVNYAA